MHQGHFFPLQLQMLLNLQRTTGISRRALRQTLVHEFDPQGIHVAHIIIDGQIDTARVRSMPPNCEKHTLLAPDAIAQTYWQLYQQDATTWTQEIDLRPSVEKF
jgi:hypothetical protein